MAKTGPTPQSDSPRALTRRVPGVELADVAIALPPPDPTWREATREAYLRYAESDVARMLQDQDVPQVLDLFRYRDRKALLDARLDVELAQGLEVNKTAQAIKILDGIIARLSSELGVGPLARVRLGIKRVEGASKLDAFLGGD